MNGDVRRLLIAWVATSTAVCGSALVLAVHAFDAGGASAVGLITLLRDHEIFASLPIATKERLASSLVEVHAADGAAVVVEGDAGDRFYLIAEGRLEVFQGGSYRRTMAVGEGFGEIALLRNTPRTATVRAWGPAVLLALERAPFIEAVTGQVYSARAADELVRERERN